MVRVPKYLNGPGWGDAILRTLFIWYETPISKYWPERKKSIYYFRWFAAYLFLTGIYPPYHRFITWLTQYYPFSLLYKGSLLHAEGIRARNLMRGMEKLADEAGIPVYINDGHGGRDLSVFYGKFERGGLKKKECLEKLQEIFQEKYGTVYVQDKDVGFRVLVANELMD